MVDTNVLFSAILFPDGTTSKALQKCISEHEIVIASYVIDELKRIVAKKVPSKIEAIDLFFNKLSFELVYTPENIKEGLFEIRDKKDYPILYTAIVENVDVILTGDADFKSTDISHPEIVTPSEFLEKF
jgi:putative PIN family toxin of toxin-antitoxin system